MERDARGGVERLRFPAVRPALNLLTIWDGDGGLQIRFPFLFRTPETANHPLQFTN
jgi:hypothetical protein